MALEIEESFQVPAHPDRVWAFLVDPARVVECLPGAELLESTDARNFRGKMKVSVGPVSLTYEGSAEFVEIDEERRHVRVQARGQEARGPGSARMTMESTVAAGAEGGSEVRVRATVEVAGKIAQFGRGMIQTVSRELFRKFSDCTRTELSQARADDEPPPEESPPGEDQSIRPVRLLFSALRQRIRSLFGG